ncbi:MAG: hypothetical protein ACRED8_06870 [Caulobacteraceae bacterium]
MFAHLTHGAWRLDLWFEDRLGRPYNVLLSVGLTIEIVRRLIELPHRLASTDRIVGAALIILMEAALLIHQLGALHHMRARRATRRAPETQTEG